MCVEAPRFETNRSFKSLLCRRYFKGLGERNTQRQIAVKGLAIEFDSLAQQTYGLVNVVALKRIDPAN